MFLKGGTIRRLVHSAERSLPLLRDIRLGLRPAALATAAQDMPTMIRMKLGGHRKYFSANIARRDRRVVFISEFPLRREPKMAYALKRAGWDVVMLYRRGLGFTDTSDFVEVIRYDSPWEAVELAHKMKSRLFHHFTAAWDSALLCLLANKPGKVVVDIYDYQFGVSHGIPEAEDRHWDDIRHQKYCLRNADALVCPDLQLQYWRKHYPVGRGIPLLFFPNYCWARQELPPPRMIGDTRIVQAGGMAFETLGAKDVGSFRVVKAFVDAGFSFDFYMYPADMMTVGTEAYYNKFGDYLELAAKTGRVTIHPSVPAHNLISELTRYDYGFAMINASTFDDVPWKHHNPAWLPYIASARFYDYLDAGLGMLADGNQALNRHLFRRSGAFLNGTEVIRSGRIREALASRPPREQILKAREALSVTRNIHRLVDFYEKLH